MTSVSTEAGENRQKVCRILCRRRPIKGLQLPGQVAVERFLSSNAEVQWYRRLLAPLLLRDLRSISALMHGMFAPQQQHHAITMHTIHSSAPALLVASCRQH
jgi:hypothetical protein